MAGRKQSEFKGLNQEDIGAELEKESSPFRSWGREPVCELLAGCNPFSLLLPQLLNEFHVLFLPLLACLFLSSPVAAVLGC